LQSTVNYNKARITNNRQWWKQPYDALINKLKGDYYAENLIKALLPLIETNALQFAANNEASLKDKIKRILIILFQSTKTEIPNSLIKTDVTFWPAQLSHLNFLIPVYRKLIEKNVSCIFISTNKVISEYLEHQQINFVHILSRRKDKFYSINVKRFYKILKIERTIRQFKNTEYSYNFLQIVYNSILFFPIYEQYLEIFNTISKQTHSKYNLVGYDFSLIGRIISGISRESGTLCGVIQHGMLNYNLIFYSTINQCFLWDQETYDLIPEECKSGNVKYHITGPPQIYKPVSAEPEELQKLKESVIDKYKLTCLIAFSGFGHNISKEGHEKNIEVIIQLIKNSPDKFFIIKLHDKDSSHFYKQLDDSKNVMIISKTNLLYKYKIKDFLSISDLTISGASTSIFESFQNQKPVISLDCLQELGHIEFLMSKMLYNCKNYEEIQSAFVSIMSKDILFLSKFSLISEFKIKNEQLLASNPALSITNKIIETINN